jgi:hypothetical protein
MSATLASRQPLGLPGFTFADLHLPERLAELHTRFADEVRGLEPELWARWEAHRAAPAALGPVDRSAVLVALAPHVSRFVARLFAVGDEAARLADATRAYDDLFRFKIDFVRRRALLLLKGGAAAPPPHRRRPRLRRGGVRRGDRPAGPRAAPGRGRVRSARP